MTLGELWMEFGAHSADIPIVIDINGNGRIPVRGADVFRDEDGDAVLMLTNMEGSK